MNKPAFFKGRFIFYRKTHQKIETKYQIIKDIEQKKYNR